MLGDLHTFRMKRLYHPLACVLFLLAATRLVAGPPRSYDTIERNSTEARLITEEDYAGLQELEPVWILEVRNDSVHVIRNQFVSPGDEMVAQRAFPVKMVRVAKAWTEVNEHGRHSFYFPEPYIGIRPDGTPVEQPVEWLPEKQVDSMGRRLIYSPAKKLLLLYHIQPRGVEIFTPEGRCLTDLPFALTGAMHFDMAERIMGIVTSELEAGDRTIELQQMVVLDYNGQLLYQSTWTECEFWNGHMCMSIDGNVLWFELSDCAEECECMLKIDEGRYHRMGELPGGGRHFSQDGRFVAVYAKPHFRLFDLSDPALPRMVWTARMQGDDAPAFEWAALSNVPGLLVYGPGRLGGENEGNLYLNVIAAGDCRPCGRLVSAHGRQLVGPVVFAGDYLFCGTRFDCGVFLPDTKHILLYDLSEFAQKTE